MWTKYTFSATRLHKYQDSDVGFYGPQYAVKNRKEVKFKFTAFIATLIHFSSVFP